MLSGSARYVVNPNAEESHAELVEQVELCCRI